MGSIPRESSQEVLQHLLQLASKKTSERTNATQSVSQLGLKLADFPGKFTSAGRMTAASVSIELYCHTFK